MCGIAGILSFSGAPVIAETLIQFIDSMAHRDMEISYYGKKSVHQWWNNRLALIDIPDTYESCVEYMRFQLDDACRIRMRSDVLLATTLSCGIDSSAVYSSIYHVRQQSDSLARTASNWQYAFTASFPGAPTDETSYAHMVTNQIGGSLIEVQESHQAILKNIISDTVKFDSIYLSPVNVASSFYNTMHSQGIRVSINGHGVDEMMYEYSHLVADAWTQEHLKGNKDYAHDLAATYDSLFPPEQFFAAEASLYQRYQEKSKPAAVRTSFRQLHDDLVPEAIKREYRALRKSPAAPLAWLKLDTTGFIGQTLNPQFAEFELYTEFHTTILPTLLRNYDRSSMLSGIESRMPFMDYRMVSFMFSLPREYKVGHVYTKRILRDAIRPRLPAEIVNRTWKVGFNAPMLDWFAGPLRGWLEDTVHSRSFRESPWWNAKAIIKTVEDKQKSNTWGQEECMTLWPVLSAHLILNKT